MAAFLILSGYMTSVCCGVASRWIGFEPIIICYFLFEPTLIGAMLICHMLLGWGGPKSRLCRQATISFLNNRRPFSVIEELSGVCYLFYLYVRSQSHLILARVVYMSCTDLCV